MMDEISTRNRALEWIILGPTGMSSKAIWAVMMGVVTRENRAELAQYQFDVPQDRDDFGRCHDLLEWLPEWKSRIREVGEVFPEWKSFTDNWGYLDIQYQEDEDISRNLQRFRDEGRRETGWTETSPGCWTAPDGGKSVQIGPEFREKVNQLRKRGEQGA